MKIKNTTILIIIITLILALFSGCTSSKEIKLNLKVGDKYKVTQSDNEKMTMKLNEKEFDFIQNHTSVYVNNITNIDKDGNVTVSVKYESLSLKENSDDGATEFDSKNDDGKNNEPEILACRSMVGQGFTYIIDKKGKVKSIDGIDKMFQSALGKLTGIDSATKDVVLKKLKNNFGEDVLKDDLTEMSGIYPDKNHKATKGYSWKNEQTLKDNEMPIKVSNVYKVKEIKDTWFGIDLNSTVSSIDTGKYIDIEGGKMKCSLSGSEKGTINVNKSNAFIQNAKVTLNLTGTGDINVSDQNFSCPITIEGTNEYSVEKN